MSCRSLLLASTVLAGLLMPGAASAENRLALVIGNSAYKTASPLPNPVNDAKVVSELLQSAGFEVLPTSDLSQEEMRRVITEFAAKVAAKGQDTVALVYYAGHGVQVGGENFLIPVDARIKTEPEVAIHAVRFDDLMNALEAVPTKARIVILDACRNNPFEDMKKTVGRGLAMVNAPVGSVVAYSTSPGTEAEDGQGTNSPFTEAFVAAAKEPGVPIEQIFKRVRLTVHTATGGRQTPWEVLSLTNNFSFFPTGTDRTTPMAGALPSGGNAARASAPGAGGSSDAGRVTFTPNSVTPTQVALTTPARAPAGDWESESPTVRSAYWKKQMQGLTQPRAFDLVIREDNVDAYRVYLAMFPNAPQSPQIRTIVERRVVMHAWYTAVTIDSPTAYDAFLKKYGTSDLATTARSLMGRAATKLALADPSTLNLNCGCTVPTVAPTRRVDTKPQQKKVQQTRNTRRSAPVDDIDDPPPRGGPVMVPIGIGIGIGGMGRPNHGGGMRPSGGSMGTHSTPPRRYPNR